MASGYSIVSQSQSVALGADQQLHDVMVVTFQTSSDVLASVRIALSEYSAASVAAAIEARLPALDAVAAL